MTNETPRELRSEAKRTIDRVAFVVFAVLAANALTAFAIQAWMTYGFAREVWELPRSLSFALIVALDVFAIMYMILTYLLRGTGWPRFAATVVFLFAIGAQVFAAELFGDHRNWTAEVRWFAGLPAIFLALAQEGVILWRTHRNDSAPERRREPEPAASEVPLKPPAAAPTPTPPPAPAVRKERVDAGKTQVKTAQRPQKVTGKVEHHDRLAAEIVAGKTTTQEVAVAEHVSKRAVQLWVKEYRQRHPDSADPENAKPEASRLYHEEGPRLTPPPSIEVLNAMSSTNVRPINGNAPEVTR